ncbi:MAG: hypothetical protein LAT81_09860 [Oceanicaulis sp.]|nr:hypothetical protein [Oceanicaulis sp.]
MHFEKNQKLINLICEVEFIPLSRVSGVNFFGNPFEKQVNTTGGFSKIYGTPVAMIFTQRQSLTKSGSQYEQRITLLYPGLEVTTSPNLYTLDQARHLVKFKDHHGQIFIMGSLDQGCRMRWNYDIQRANFSITFDLEDSVPIGFDRELGNFFINNQGILIQTYESTETFYLDANGNLVVDGPDEAAYSIINGNLQRTN